MPGGTYGAEGGSTLARPKSVDRLEAGARSQARRVPRLGYGGRVGIEVAAPGETELLDALYVCGVVDGSQLSDARESRSDGDEVVAQPSVVDAAQHGTEPLWSFGVSGARAVTDESLVGDQQHSTHVDTLGAGCLSRVRTDG